MPTRWAVEKAVRGSDLPPPARLIMLTLLTLADNDSAVIPARFSPSLATLHDATGLGRSTIARHLVALEEDSWVTRVPGGGRGHRTGYKLGGPAPGLFPRKTVPLRDHKPSRSRTANGPAAGPVPTRPTVPTAHAFRLGANGYCAAPGCGRSAPLHPSLEED